MEKVTLVDLSEIVGISAAGLARYCSRHGIATTKVRGKDGRWRNAVSAEDAERIVDNRRHFETSPEILNRLRNRAAEPAPWDDV